MEVEVTLVERVADVLAKTGGWGLSAILMFVIVKQQAKVDALQKELRDALVDTTKKLVTVLTENNIISKQQVEALQKVLDKIT